MIAGDSTVLLGGFFNASPFVAGWAVAVVTAVVVIRRGRRKVGHLMLVGSILMLVNSLLAVPEAVIVPFLVQRGMVLAKASFMLGIFDLSRGMIGMAGIICLICAFAIV